MDQPPSTYGPLSVHRADGKDVVSRHLFDPRVRLLCAHQPARLQRIEGHVLISAGHNRDTTFSQNLNNIWA